ncbi:MAG: 7-cyano-7-deazaguanine synthase [Thaumarchaeota archaeon]|nr:7-cyano-7-deazaguanine synthase [Nitrososphaerota archaeon]
MLLSGGIDSATCLYLSRKKGNLNRALTIRFHGIARGEVRAATRLARAAGVEEHRFFSMPELMEVSDIGSPGRLAALPSTYIPMKNSIYYSVAAAFAEEVGAERVVGGHNSDDRALFEDTADVFFREMQKTLRTASARLREQDFRIWRPLRTMTKAEVVTLAARLGVPLEMTWSCHREGSAHCWECDGCLQRERSFRQAGLRDPLRDGKDRKGIKRVVSGQIRASREGSGRTDT